MKKLLTLSVVATVAIMATATVLTSCSSKNNDPQPEEQQPDPEPDPVPQHTYVIPATKWNMTHFALPEGSLLATKYPDGYFGTDGFGPADADMPRFFFEFGTDSTTLAPKEVSGALDGPTLTPWGKEAATYVYDGDKKISLKIPVDLIDTETWEDVEFVFEYEFTIDKYEGGIMDVTLSKNNESQNTGPERFLSSYSKLRLAKQ